MSNDDWYDEIPDDPEEAFIYIEEHFRTECDNSLEKSGDFNEAQRIHTSYISKVIAAILELEISDSFKHVDVPPVETVDYHTYLNFSKDVDHYLARLKIRHSRRRQGFSVRFDEAAKQKLRHFLSQMKELVGKLEISEKKKEDLFKKINSLQEEVDRNRTRFDSLAALTIESAGVVGDAVDKSKLIEVLDSIGRVFWRAKESEGRKRLPPPTEPKRIPPPDNSDDDEEIPF